MSLQGEFAPNTRLRSAVRLFEGQVHGAGEQQLNNSSSSSSSMLGSAAAAGEAAEAT
jgi:hypothetical protein